MKLSTFSTAFRLDRRLSLVSSTLVAALVAACGASPGGDATEAVSKSGSAATAATATGGVMPTVSGSKAGATAALSPASGTTNLTYGGGSVISNVTAIPVFWGPSVDATTKAGIPAYLSTLTGGGYVSWLSDYNTPSQTIGNGAPVAARTISPGNSATTLAPSDISNELNGQIKGGALPAPTANSLYIVYLPPGDTATLGSSQSCTDFCGYHSSASSTNGGYSSVRFAVIPDLGAATCDCHGDSVVFNDVTEVTSHEVGESITDPDPFSGWNSAGGEIGDLCAWQPGILLGSSPTPYTVQSLWSNAAQGCIVTHFGPVQPWSNVNFDGTVTNLVADVTGDGKADAVGFNYDNIWVMPSTGSSFGPMQQWSSTPFDGTVTNLLADVDGDGKADAVGFNSNNIWVMLSTGSSFAPAKEWSSINFDGTVTNLLADVDGDHKADVVGFNSNNIWVMLSTGSSFGPEKEWSSINFDGKVTNLVADVDGDGKADAVGFNPTNIWVMLSTGSSFAAEQRWSGATFDGTVKNLLADVNGDGKADAVGFNYSNSWVMLSNGSSFNAPARWSATPFDGSVTNLVADVNGDKRADAIGFFPSSTFAMLSQ